MLVPNGIGGSTISQWSGELTSSQVNVDPRFGVAVRRTLSVGLTPTVVLFMQGETDNVNGTTQASYAASGALMLASMRTVLPTTPILVGICTLYNNTVVSSGIHAAQAGLVDAPGNVLAGANTDTLTGATNRQQPAGVHLNATGADAAAFAMGDCCSHNVRDLTLSIDGVAIPRLARRWSCINGAGTPSESGWSRLRSVGTDGAP